MGTELLSIITKYTNSYLNKHPMKHSSLRIFEQNYDGMAQAFLKPGLLIKLKFLKYIPFKLIKLTLKQIIKDNIY